MAGDFLPVDLRGQARVAQVVGHIAQDALRAVDSHGPRAFPAAVAAIPLPHFRHPVGQPGLCEKPFHLLIREAEAAGKQEVGEIAEHEIVEGVETVGLEDAHRPHEDGKIEIRVVLERHVEHGMEEIHHVAMVAVQHCLPQQDIVPVDEQGWIFPVMGMEGAAKVVQGIGKAGIVDSGVLEPAQVFQAIRGNLRAAPNLAELPAQAEQQPAQALPRPGEGVARDAVQGKENDGAAVHPPLAQLPVGRHVQPPEKRPAVLADVEEFGKHGHVQGPAEMAGDRDLGDDRREADEQVFQERRLVDVEAALLAQGTERTFANADIGKSHGMFLFLQCPGTGAMCGRAGRTGCFPSRATAILSAVRPLARTIPAPMPVTAKGCGTSRRRLPAHTGERAAPWGSPAGRSGKRFFQDGRGVLPAPRPHFRAGGLPARPKARGLSRWKRRLSSSQRKNMRTAER